MSELAKVFVSRLSALVKHEPMPGVTYPEVLMVDAPLPERSAAQRLIHEHEMGELFKVLGLARGIEFDALGFVSGDRSHRL